MTQPSELKARQILVALDASEPGLAALEAATTLATQLHAELQAMFVEDENLLRFAGLPFARETVFSSGVQRPLDVAKMERMLRAKARNIQKAIAARARHDRFHYTFRVARGQLARATLEDSSGAELLFMGSETPSSAPIRSSPAASRNRPFVVIFDGSAGARRALEVAARLAQHDSDNVLIVIPQDEEHLFEALRRESFDWLAGRGLRLLCLLAAELNETTIAELANEHDAKLLLINEESRLFNDANVESLVNDLQCPVGLVRTPEVDATVR
jgi:nucleotide-binding universal stress UspA family protein